MKVLVTGANGFVGQEIVAELLENQHEVFSFVGLNYRDEKHLPNVFRADITEFEKLPEPEQIGVVDVVIHSAGLAHQFGKTSDEEFLRVNVRGTENIASLAHVLKAKHFILISSVAVYGEREQKMPVDETNICQPKGIYAVSKYQAEKSAREICEKNNISLTILRPVTVIGENDRGNTARLIESIDKGHFVWIGKGENRKSLIYKKDVARACLKVLKKGTDKTEIFNVTGEALKMNVIVKAIAEGLNRKISGIRISVKLLEKVFLLNEKLPNIGKISKLRQIVAKWVSEDVFGGDLIFKNYGFRFQTKIKDAIGLQTEFYKKNLRKNR